MPSIAPPFSPAPGQFRIKGVAYRGHLEFVERRVPGGVKAQNEAFKDARVVEFFSQPFVAGGWYDVYPLVHAGVICAELRGQTLSQLLKERGKDQVTRDLSGVYGFLARFANQRLVARGVVDATQRYFDFATARSEQLTPKHVRTRITGVPDAIGDWFLALAQSYTEATFEHVGADDVQVRVQRVASASRKGSVPLSELTLDVEWSG